MGQRWTAEIIEQKAIAEIKRAISNWNELNDYEWAVLKAAAIRRMLLEEEKRDDEERQTRVAASDNKGST